MLSIECAECHFFLLASRNRCILASSFLLRDHGLLFDPSMAYSSYIQVINGLKRLSVHKNSVNRKATTRTRGSLIMHELEYTGNMRIYPNNLRIILDRMQKNCCLLPFELLLSNFDGRCVKIEFIVGLSGNSEIFIIYE